MQVGNAVTDNYYDNLGTVTYWWSHAMISDKTYKQLINTCDFRRQKNSDQCESLYSYAMDKEFGNIDQYNIYAPPCNNSDGSTRTSTRQTAMHLPHRPVYIIQIFRQVSSIICILIRMYLQHSLFSFCSKDVPANIRLWSLYGEICWTLLQQARCTESTPCQHNQNSL